METTSPLPSPRGKLDPQLWASPDKEGVLWKRGHRRKNWKKRVFKLKGPLLFYFNPSSAGGAPAGFIVLKGGHVEFVVDKKFQYCMELRVPNDPKKLFLIAAGSNQELQAWISAIMIYKDKSDLGQQEAPNPERDAAKCGGSTIARDLSPPGSRPPPVPGVGLPQAVSSPPSSPRLFASSSPTPVGLVSLASRAPAESVPPPPPPPELLAEDDDVIAEPPSALHQVASSTRLNALLAACAAADLETVTAVLAAEADPAALINTKRESDDEYALCAAAAAGSVAIVKLLLESGANEELESEAHSGFSAMQVAIMKGFSEIVALFP